MNLGKLLGAGKTIFVGNRNVAYREDKKFYLPKFNAEKNPFTPKPVAPAPEAKTAVARMEQVSVPGSASVAAKTQNTPVLAAGPTRAISWKDKLNPFRAPEPVRPNPAGAVQVELSLEAVRVVHNDLADADIEIVPVKSRPAALEPASCPPAHAAWGFLSEQLVKQS